MMFRTIRILMLIALIPISWFAWTTLRPSSDQVIASQLSAGTFEVEGFQRATPDQPLEFPADFGSHPGFQTEWWYYTGNLETDTGRHFGYQLTFFRRALIPAATTKPRASTWATDQVYFAHFTLTDVDGKAFQSFERFARGAAGLAGAQASPYQVWLEHWQVQETGKNTYRLLASEDEIRVDFELIDRKGPILQGDRGYSQKGPETGNASYYYSQTALETRGTIEVDGETFQVSGKSWKDHEYSTSALSSDQVGWDWFSIQLDNNIEVMLFHIRKTDGSIDPVSSGILVMADGSTKRFSKDQFEIQIEDTWVSPRSGAEYPSRWTINIPSESISLNLEPFLADQELNVSFNYWEGAVKISGTKAGVSVTGFGYVEMTGYVESMAEQF